MPILPEISKTEEHTEQRVRVQLPAIYFNDALGKLEFAEGLFIKQKLELFEAVSGCETQNKYSIYAANKDGEQTTKLTLFKCTEKSGFFARQFLTGSCRPFKAKVEHDSGMFGGSGGNKCFEFERKCRLTFLCFNRPDIKIYLTEDSEKKYLGKVVNPCTFLDLQLDIYDDKDEKIYKIIGSCCQLGVWYGKFPCKACQTVQFYVHDAKTGEKLTELMKKTAGCTKSFISDADNFSLVFPKNASKEIRAVLMGAVIMLDFMYFEKNEEKKCSIWNFI